MIIDWTQLLDAVAISVVSAGATYIVVSMIRRRNDVERNIDGTCIHHNKAYERGQQIVHDLKAELDATYLRKDVYVVKHTSVLEAIKNMQVEARESREEIKDYMKDQFDTIRSLISRNGGSK